MEGRQVLAGKHTDYRAHLVRVFPVEGRMLQQLQDVRQLAGVAAGRLYREPELHHLRTISEALVEQLDSLFTICCKAGIDQRPQDTQAVRHVVCTAELL